MKLTHKQESFAQLVAQGNEQSTSYRTAYDADGMTDKQIWEEASKLAAHPKVSQRIEKLKDTNTERNAITLDEITNGIREAALIARTKKEANALTTAYMGLAKVGGLLIDKKEQVGVITVKELIAEIDEE